MFNIVAINKNFNQLPAGSMREGFGRELAVLAQKNEQIVALTADLLSSTRLNYFQKNFPHRLINVGVAEQNLLGVAAGLAMVGKIPVTTSFAVFQPGRNWEQLRQTVCLNQLNVKLVSTHSGLSVGPDGATHQALEDLALTLALPNLMVLSPCDELQTRQVLRAAIHHQGPVYIRLTRENSPQLTTWRSDFQLGRAQFFRLGKDVTLITTGIMAANVLLAAKILAERHQIEAQVINVHTLKPLDEDSILSSITQTKGVVVIEEHQKFGGLTGLIANLLAAKLPRPLESVAVEDRFGQTGRTNELWEEYGLTVENIVKKAKLAISRSADHR